LGLACQNFTSTEYTTNPISPSPQQNEGERLPRHIALRKPQNDADRISIRRLETQWYRLVRVMGHEIHLLAANGIPKLL